VTDEARAASTSSGWPSELMTSSTGWASRSRHSTSWGALRARAGSGRSGAERGADACRPPL